MFWKATINNGVKCSLFLCGMHSAMECIWLQIVNLFILNDYH